MGGLPAWGVPGWFLARLRGDPVSEQPSSNLVEREYRLRVSRLSGPERVRLALELQAELCALTRRRIRIAEPDISEQALRRRVAETIYRTDPGARHLLCLLDEPRSDG